MSFYPDRVQKFFADPRNVGEVAAESAAGETASLACGAIVRLSLKIDPQSQRITEARFKAVGCGFLIASVSILTEVIKGLTTAEAASVSELYEESVAKHFGELPAERRHCARLCGEALVEAITYYSHLVREEWTGEEALICTCFGVSEKTIERVIKEGNLHTVKEVTRACSAGGGCHSCRPLIEEILEDYWRLRQRTGD